MQEAAHSSQDGAPAGDGATQQRARTDEIVSGVLRGVFESLGPALVQRLGVTIRQPNGTTVGAVGQQAPPRAAAEPQQAAPTSVQSFPVGGDETDEEDIKEPADKRHKPAHEASTAAADAPLAGPAQTRAPPVDGAGASASTKPVAGPSGLGPKGGLGKGLGPSLPPKRPAKRTPATDSTADAARAGGRGLMVECSTIRVQQACRR